jgi:hypothetical protein
VELGEIIRQHFCLCLGTGRNRTQFLEMCTGLGEAFDLCGDRRLILRRHGKNAILVSVREEVQQRILIRSLFEITTSVEFRVEFRGGIAALLVAVKHEMLERIDPGRGDVGVGLKIVLSVELRDRTVRSDAILQIMGKGAFADGNLVFLAVPDRLEVRARTTAFPLPDGCIMQQRLNTCLLHIGIGREIPDRIKDRIGPATFLESIQKEVLERVRPNGNNVRIGRRIIGLVEKSEPLQKPRSRRNVVFRYLIGIQRSCRTFDVFFEVCGLRVAVRPRLAGAGKPNP